MNQATNQAGQASEQPAGPEIQPGERFLKIPEVRGMTGVAVSTLYRLMGEDEFPKSVPLPGGRVAWLESEVLQWMKKRVALREAAN